MFDVAAESYDRFMGLYSTQLSAQLADLAGVRSGQRVLDVGCGPGILTAELVERVGADAVAAVDPSEPFVAAAQARYPEVDVRLGPAEDLPYPDDHFDAALAQLVVHFMADAVAGLAEMARVTRPGGVVAASVWDMGGARGPMSPVWRVVRELGHDAEREAYLAGVREGQLGELFARAGLVEIEEVEQPAAVDYPDFETWWEPFTYGIGPVGAFVRSIDDEERDRLRRALGERVGDGPFTIDVVAWAARGVVA